MTSLKPTVVALVLQRDGISQPWGFRLSGGCDVDHPLIVTKVMLGSPSDGVLQTGDLIKKIGNYDARDLSHKDALSLFKNSGGSISVAVERMLPVERRQESRNTLSFIPQPPIPGAVATPFTVAGISKYERKRPIRNNYCVFPPELLKASSADSQYSMISSHSEETHSVTEEVVTRQFNSPIGLYSEQNIANSVNTHLGGSGGGVPNGGGSVYYNPPNRIKKTVLYDPSKSETYKALQETEFGNHHPHQEHIIPVTRVFSPVTKTPTKHLPPPTNTYCGAPNRASPQPHPTAPHPKMDYGVPPEEIHQSNSFKRLMNMVMTDY